MAVVYLADDLRHGRRVALKVLKPELAAVVGAERFLAEIRMTASLQHPHILPLFDSGQADGFLFYVMPYVEGESLRERLERERQLPMDEAVDIAANVAEALDYAHRHGVIHRDIKPANILLHDGNPVVADFGIALALGAAGAGRLTETGLSVGTPYYMSPEQATGDQQVAPTSDIYSLGCVLYEMLVGEPPYTGSTPQAVLGRIISGSVPSASAERASVPPNVDAAVRKALEKVPADRFTGASAFAGALSDTAFRHGGTTGASGELPAAPRSRVAAAGWVTAAGLALVAGWALLGNPEDALELTTERVSLMLPPERSVRFGCTPCSSLAISPDGRAVVYVARATQSENAWPGLVVRDLVSRTVRDLPGTEGATQPFFSPDGRWVAFFTADALKKVPLAGAGGNALALAEGITGAQWGFGAWTDQGEIVFATVGTAGLHRVSAEGGPIESLTSVDTSRGESAHRYPDFVPGTRTVLFTVVAGADGRIESLDLDSGARRVVVERGSQATLMSPGALVYARDGEIVAVRFDAGRLAATGEAVPLGDESRTDGFDPGREGNVLQMAVSRTGTLAYVPPPPQSAARLGIVGGDGSFTAFGPELTDPGLATLRASPDGRLVAFGGRTGNASELYVHDLARGSTDRLTQGGYAQGPAWRPGGGGLTMYSVRDEGRGIFLRDPEGAERLLLPEDAPELARNMSWSPDGSVLAYTVQSSSEYDIWVVSPDDPASARPLIAGPAAEYSPRFSPDGRWLAYVSDESGRHEVYVRGYPEGERLRVSTNGALGAVWSPDGATLFLQGGTFEQVSDFMAVSVAREGATRSLGTPTPLFPERVRGDGGVYYSYAISTGAGLRFDVLPDGRRFVMVRTVESPAREIVLLRNLAQELERLAPK